MIGDIDIAALEVLAQSADVYGSAMVLHEAIEDGCVDGYVNARRNMLDYELVKLDRAIGSLRKAIGEQGGEED